MTDRADRHESGVVVVDLQAVQSDTLRLRLACGWARRFSAIAGGFTGTVGSAAIGFRVRTHMGDPASPEDAVELDSANRVDETTPRVEFDVEPYAEIEVHVEVSSGQSAATARLQWRLDEQGAGA